MRARLRVLLLALVAIGCGERVGQGSEDDGGVHGRLDADESGDGGTSDGGGANDGGGASDGGGSTDGGGTFDAGIIVDSGHTNEDAGNATVDAGVTNVDAGGSSAAQLTQYSSRSCWSWGGFGTVRPDAPAHVIGFLEDQDGVGDIVMSAEIIIFGTGWPGGQYSLGERALIPWGDSGCCRRATKVPIDYTDFIAAAGVIDTSTNWGARVIYRDHGGHTTTAECSGVAGWVVNSTPIGM